MKIPLPLVAAVLAPILAAAADVELSDGRVLRDAEVRSQTVRTVIISHAGGLSSVPKALLPAELQAKYPLDESAIAEADRQEGIEKEKAEAVRKAVEAKRAHVWEQRKRVAAAEGAAKAEASARAVEEEAALWSGATACAENHFLKDYDRNAYYDRTCTVAIEELRPMEGWTNRWFVRGRAVVRTYEPEPWMLRPGNDRTLAKSAKARHEEMRRRHVRSETRDFEGVYSTDGEKPTLDVTLR